MKSLLVRYRIEGKQAMSEWREVELQQIVSKLGDGLHGTPQYDDDGE